MGPGLRDRAANDSTLGMEHNLGPILDEWREVHNLLFWQTNEPGTYPINTVFTKAGAIEATQKALALVDKTKPNTPERKTALTFLNTGLLEPLLKNSGRFKQTEWDALEERILGYAGDESVGQTWLNQIKDLGITIQD